MPTVSGCLAVHPLSRAAGPGNGLRTRSTTDLTAASTSSPVSVRSGCRKAMPKWTLCLSSGRFPPWKVSRYWSGFQGRPGRADHNLGQLGPGQVACHDQRQVADHAPETAAAAGTGPRARPVSIGHRTPARPPSRRSRSSKACEPRRDRPRPDSRGASRPAAARPTGPGAKQRDLDRPRRRAAPATCSALEQAPRRSP